MYVYVQMHIYMYVHVCVCVCVYIHIYIYTHTHKAEGRILYSKKISRNIADKYMHFQKIKLLNLDQWFSVWFQDFLQY